MQKQKFLIYAAGIFCSYFYFGIVQEKITRGKYTYETLDENGNKTINNEKYVYALTLVFVQCVINYLVARLAVSIWPQEEDKTHKLYYASMSITYLLAMVCSNMALQWVPYPTQVVGKSAKPIPKYVFVFMIVLGVVLFMLKDQASAVSQDTTVGVGELLLLLSLLMDGLTGAIQDRIRAESRPTGIQMMQVGNAWSTLFLSVTILVTGEYSRFWEFAKRHPQVLNNLLVLGVTSSIGQLFLYSMVSAFGPLVLSVVTTTRKFFTVLGSVILFGNTLSPRQWIGAVVVFTALFLDAFYAKSPPKKS